MSPADRGLKRGRSFQISFMNATPIARIYVCVCRYDFHLARLCVASIRYWHPDIPVTLIPDFNVGEFDSRPLQRDWNVDVFKTEIRKFGWGYSKFEILFLERRERYLMLDADIVLLGPILNLLDQTSGDFVVHPDIKTRRQVEMVEFTPELLAAFDPSYVQPRFYFNSGQYVGTTGLLRREDFDSVLEWTMPRRLRRPDVFRESDQGIFNYVLAKAEAAGRLSVEWRKFSLWRGEDHSRFTVEQIAARTSEPRLLHWAGYKSDTIERMERADILAFYARYERSRLPLRSRLTYWYRDQPGRKAKARVRRAAWLAKQWLAGAPYAAGGPIEEIKPDDLRNFHDVEKEGAIRWRWTQPEASVTLAIPPTRHRVRIETASPEPMTGLKNSNPRFFINGRSIPEEVVTISSGIVEIDLEAPLLRAGQTQVLGWSMDRLPAHEREERALGMPIAALWVFRGARSVVTAR